MISVQRKDESNRNETKRKRRRIENVSVPVSRIYQSGQVVLEFPNEIHLFFDNKRKMIYRQFINVDRRIGFRVLVARDLLRFSAHVSLGFSFCFLLFSYCFLYVIRCQKQIPCLLKQNIKQTEIPKYTELFLRVFPINSIVPSNQLFPDQITKISKSRRHGGIEVKD